MKLPLPSNEAARLASLRTYNILDTGPEVSFDDLTLLAATICQAPMATISLIEENRQWFKSRIGVKAQETPRDVSFCTHTILHTDTVMEIRDASLDARFAQSPLVTSNENVRFYAGAPLVTPDGFALGALCVMDRIPRTLTPEQRAALQALSRFAITQLELKRQAHRLAKEETETARLLVEAKRSRRALLSVLEDERLAGENLRKSEELFRQMAENIDEVFWISNADLTEVLYVSPAVTKVWGLTCQSIYANPLTWLESIVPEDRERIQRVVAELKATGEFNVEFRIAQPDGSIRWIHDRGYPVKGGDGRIERMVGVAEDITEAKKLEEQFLRAQRMEAIGTLAGGIAHDLNNILGPVLMISELLRAKVTTPRELEMIGMLENSAQRGAGIIRQLLTFSRGATGQRISVQLRHLIRDMVAIMRETFPREISIVEQITADLWLIKGDATQLHQVILNLCVNARDAMPDGGQLSVGAHNLEITLSNLNQHPEAKVGRYVLMTVADTGEGIPPAIMKRIFDPFFTTKEIGKGTGLGLSTVIGIVKSHDGFINVESEVGQGSRFKVYLPIDDSAGAAGPSTSEDAAAGGNQELILVVDDETQIAKATSLSLEQQNYRVLIANHGKHALALYLENQDEVRLVLTDIMMPVMGGVALARALRAIKPDLPIIATTGLDQQGRQEELAALGVTDILMKPCSPQDLRNAVRRRLEHR